MDDAALTKIAERVSIILQLDRNRHKISTQVNFQALENIPAYLASVFEKANELDAELEPAEVYRLVNRRVSEVQAQLYLIRLELDNKYEHDPAKLYDDPLVVSTYGKRLVASLQEPKRFGFEPSLVASGWYPPEGANGNYWRWMRPGKNSLVLLPHLGKLDQLIQIRGRALVPEQVPRLNIRANGTEAEIEIAKELPEHFIARLRLTKEHFDNTNLLPIEFEIQDFRQPSLDDTRMLGACILQFTCSPLVEAYKVDSQ